MTPFNHREPGMIGGVFTNDDLYGEIICDLVHVHPMAVKSLVLCKGADKALIITDCMRAGGLPDGEYKLGEMMVKVVGSIARTAKEDALAGSTTTMADCVRNMHRVVGVPLADAVKMATASPANAIGLINETGTLDVGKRADIIAVDEDFNVKFVMVNGEIKLQ